MGSASPIESVIVAGGGIVGWSAAAAIKRHLPKLQVTMIASPPSPDALADRISATLPSIVGFHDDIGLTEIDAVARTGSGYRLGTRFEGWAATRPAYVHSYSTHGSAFDGAPFHLHWVRAARRNAGEAFDSYSPSAAIGQAGRFLHPQGEAGTPLAGFQYGLQLNCTRYLQMMRAFARHLGVHEVVGSIAEVGLRAEDGFVQALRLHEGSEATADLFVDCTGPGATIRSKLGGDVEDWSRWLLCDSIRLANAPPQAEPPVLDRAIAMAAGWRWEAASPASTSLGLVYASSHQSDEDAEQQLPGGLIRIRQGRRANPWLRNCVALGDAAVTVEPLEWTNLHLAHSAIDRIVSMMPDRGCAPIELAEYNRQAEAEADRVRDFLILHYATTGRVDAPFWKEAAAVALPPSLEHTLSLFRERGRLPFFEEETFSRDSWLAVLFGQGVMPRRLDPLTDSVPPDAAEAAMSRMRASLTSLAATLPSHSTYLRTFAARAQR